MQNKRPYNYVSHSSQLWRQRMHAWSVFPSIFSSLGYTVTWILVSNLFDESFLDGPRVSAGTGQLSHIKAEMDTHTDRRGARQSGGAVSIYSNSIATSVTVRRKQDKETWKRFRYFTLHSKRNRLILQKRGISCDMRTPSIWCALLDYFINRLLTGV